MRSYLPCWGNGRPVGKGLGEIRVGEHLAIDTGFWMAINGLRVKSFESLLPAMDHVRFCLDGLKDVATVRIDRWGVSHIEARNLSDLFFAQGFNAARVKLWRIDLERKKTLGLLARDFGPGFLAQDYACRLLYGGAGRAAPNDVVYASRENFSRGVNAFVALTQNCPEHLPREFVEYGTRPGLWRANDLARLQAQADLQIAFQSVLRACERLPDERRRQVFCDDALGDVSSGVEAPLSGRNPMSALDILRLACAAPTLSRERLSAAIENAWEWTGAKLQGTAQRSARTLEEAEPQAIVVPKDLSATGRPIFLHILGPSPELYSVVHLKAPGLDAIGAGEWYLPGLRAGHDGQTVLCDGSRRFMPDKLMVLEKTRDGLGYWTRRGERRLKFRRERFDIHGAPAQSLVVRTCVAGPVLFENDIFALAIDAFRPFRAQYAKGSGPLRARALSSEKISSRSSEAAGDQTEDFHVLTRGEVCLEASAPKTIVRRLQQKAQLKPSDCCMAGRETIRFSPGPCVAALKNLSAYGYAKLAARLLAAWDGDLQADSPAPAFYEIWTRNHLAPAIDANGDILDLDPNGERDAADEKILIASLDAAWREARRLLGPLFALWRRSDLSFMADCDEEGIAEPRLLMALDVGAWNGSFWTPTIHALRDELKATPAFAPHFAPLIYDEGPIVKPISCEIECLPSQTNP